jgi:TetR/AcrR family transcriptional regulator, ethionamide resistance regulator
VIEQLWSATRDDTVRSVTELLGSTDSVGPDDRTAALVGALVGMTERTFYEASRAGTDLDDATEVVTTIWDRTFGL